MHGHMNLKSPSKVYSQFSHFRVSPRKKGSFLSNISNAILLFIFYVHQNQNYKIREYDDINRLRYDLRTGVQALCKWLEVEVIRIINSGHVLKIVLNEISDSESTRFTFISVTCVIMARKLAH